ncbi:hypothetical protein ITI46_26365 [Streptomyces oryzae]|uniref:Uncharacterized protein n=1 Tax=Streptomyces oryzae TaxID=1434886 RepID=A0ABS3XID7_9ACTN|nr:hypothetical protein [Streptomyces oryzae]MBO8195148.1 hypothetical protein [Streptomyces oryzae]
MITHRNHRYAQLPGCTRALGDHPPFHIPGANLSGYGDHQVPPNKDLVK